ncbi:MAG: PAS domain S-box protein [Desulfohalobiaceae bacterium]|nr:PAS domain S-box protein [Desulfohalobiaceae bacterium]
MWGFWQNIRQRLLFKVLLTVGVILLGSIGLWSYFNVTYQKNTLMGNVQSELLELTETIRLGSRYAMLHNARQDIGAIVNNIGKQEKIRNIRIFNKKGAIAFSNRQEELGERVTKREERCRSCHGQDSFRSTPGPDKRIRVFRSESGHRYMGVISPIYNEPSCYQATCHAHTEEEKVLGLLDVVVSLRGVDEKLAAYERYTVFFALFVFLATYLAFALFVQRFINRPVKGMIRATQKIARGEQFTRLDVGQQDEMGQLARAIEDMGGEIEQKHKEITRERERYEQLYGLVPCLITVQDRQYRLISYNREFEHKFAPKRWEHCYRAYKGRSEKCVECPVEKTFRDGRVHTSEESGYVKDGSQAHWLVTTAPIHNPRGKVEAVMEMCLDITERKKLEEDLRRSENKYWAIFNNIPNPVFVLDAKRLTIIDCNDRVPSLYGYEKEELLQTNFLDLFLERERQEYSDLLASSSYIQKSRQRTREGGIVYTAIRVSPSEYNDRRVLLVTASDITKRLETEQQLIQSSKMTTLGEMASGIAHELNQPLTVIRTASNFLARKRLDPETFAEETVGAMLEEIDTNVERATKIINHMREFSRKPEVRSEGVQLNSVLRNAMDIFSQQLKLREIEVAWELEPDLPLIRGESNQLEQVFINLLLNARDAIEEKADRLPEAEKRIELVTWSEGDRVLARVQDTGRGIPRATRDRIFEPFFTTKEVGKGTGLGLSISYRIVQDCGGVIRVESEEEAYTRFILEFPRAEDG